MEGCILCPRNCKVDRFEGDVGTCGQTNDIRVSLHSLHLWEEPPLSGSSGSGTVFFSGCPLKCIYCQNYAISSQGKGSVVSIEELSDMFLELQDKGALNINLVTPTHFSPQIRIALQRARENGLILPIVWNTSGYETVDAIKLNEGFVDVYLTDMKYASSDLAKSLSGVADYPEVAMAAIGQMLDSTHGLHFDTYHDQQRMISGVVVRHMVLPGHADDSKQVLSRLYNAFGEDISYSIMNQYTPVLNDRALAGDKFAIKALESHPELRRTVSAEEYEDVLDLADSLGISDYYWQDGQTCLNSFIPAF